MADAWLMFFSDAEEEEENPQAQAEAEAAWLPDLEAWRHVVLSRGRWIPALKVLLLKLTSQSPQQRAFVLLLLPFSSTKKKEFWPMNAKGTVGQKGLLGTGPTGLLFSDGCATQLQSPQAVGCNASQGGFCLLLGL